MASTVLPNGIIIPEKFSRDWYADLYHNWQELDNLLGGGTPKDGTLTIQKNGSTVGTFSANQATNETVNIEVPDVNNGTLTIQKNGTDVATFSANSSTNATANITVPTKTSDLTNDSGFITEDTTKIPLAGSNAISGSLIPSTDGTVNLGGPSYQWNNAYATTFNGNVVGRGDLTLQSNSGTARIFLRNNNASSFPNSVNLYSKVNDVEYGVFLTGSAFFPTLNGEMNFGYTQRRWKSVHTNAINDINPGALSLPSISSTGANAWIALDTTNWVKSAVTSAAQKYTPPADGWLNIRVNNATMLGLAITGGSNYMHQMVRSETPNGLALLIPVFKNTEVAILVGGNENLVYDRSTFYYCQGNV